MEEGEQKVSKYNSGINIIMRLDTLWRDTHSAVKLEKYYLWNTLLDRIWCELARDLKETEYDIHDNKLKNVNQRLSDSGVIIDDKTKLEEGFKSIPKTAIDNRAKQYQLLLEKELILRRLENYLGKGTAWDEDDDDGFD